MVVINPWGMLSTVITPGAANGWFPWSAVNTNADFKLYQGSNQLAGPFAINRGSMAAWNPDLSILRFVSTLAPLNNSGGLVSTVFY